MSKDQVIEKIRKLLRMKRGGTPAEVETALAMAAELARKHGVDLAGVDPDVEPESELITHQEKILTSRLPMEAKFAAAILVNFFNVSVVIGRTYVPGRILEGRKWAVRFVGTNWDIEVAGYIFIFLQRHFRRSWSQRLNRRLKNRHAFLNGMFLGLSVKLDAERKQTMVGNEAALVFIGNALAKRNAYVAEHWETTDHTLDRDDSNARRARWAGIVAGQQTELRRGMEGAGAECKVIGNK